MSLRNSVCSCGSGRKHKKCCGKPKPREPLPAPRVLTPEEVERGEELLRLLGGVAALAGDHLIVRGERRRG